jgi:hypothetical protein
MSQVTNLDKTNKNRARTDMETLLQLQQQQVLLQQQ